MADRTWMVDVDISTVVRRTITIPVSAARRADAEASARAAVRQLEHDQLPAGYKTVRWQVDNATAHEATP